MAEDQAAKIERIDKTQQEMQEKMVEMMDMMKNFMKGKEGVSSSSQKGGTTIQEEMKEDLTHPSGYMPPQMKAYQEAYPPTMPPVGMYSYAYICLFQQCKCQIWGNKWVSMW